MNLPIGFNESGRHHAMAMGPRSVKTITTQHLNRPSSQLDRKVSPRQPRRSSG